MSSYELFDLTDDNEVEKTLVKSPTRKESRKRKKETTITTRDTTALLEEQEEEESSPCNESKRRRTSSWLATFLTKKRDLDVPEPPEVESGDITYLREFNEQFASKNSNAAQTASIDDEASDNDDNHDQIIDRKTENNNNNVDDGETPQEKSILTGKLRIYNLPYAVSVDTIKVTGRTRGFEFLNVKMLMDPKTGLSMGSADVELHASVDTEAAVQTLQGLDVSGRLIRLRYSSIFIIKSHPSTH